MTSGDEFASALNFVATARAQEVDAHLASRSGTVVRLDGDAVTDRESFLRAFGEAAFDAPLETWGHFEDEVRTAVSQAPGDEYAFVWAGAHRMLDGGLEDFVTVADACLSLARTRHIHGHRFRAFFLGDGPNFK